MAADTSDYVLELVTGTALDALDDGAAAVAIHGLKNELNRLHKLLERAQKENEQEIIWIRIVVIQEALLDVVRMIVKEKKAA